MHPGGCSQLLWRGLDLNVWCTLKNGMDLFQILERSYPQCEMVQANVLMPVESICRSGFRNLPKCDHDRPVGNEDGRVVRALAHYLESKGVYEKPRRLCVLEIKLDWAIIRDLNFSHIAIHVHFLFLVDSK